MKVYMGVEGGGSGGTLYPGEDWPLPPTDYVHRDEI